MLRENQQLVRRTSCYFVLPVLKNATQLKECVSCVCVLDREVSRVVASRALVVTQMAVHLTSYQNCLTGFCEPLSPPYIDVTPV